MARIRSIKPEFFKHIELSELENLHPGQNIMLVYAGLWTQCDKNGVFYCNAKALKNEILPYLEFDIQKTLNILEGDGYFVKYSSGGREYGFIPNFSKYQFPTQKEKNSPARYPEPPAEIEDRAQAHTGTRPDTDQNDAWNDAGNDTGAEGLKDKRILGLQDKGLKESCGSAEPPLSESQKSALELSELLLSCHRKEIPDYLSGKNDKKTIQRWAVDIEKLIRIDKKPPDNIRQVILWAKTPGNFWFNNIQSGEKLRKQFERLYGEMKTGGKRSGTGTSSHRIARDNISPDDLDQYFS